MDHTVSIGGRPRWLQKLKAASSNPTCELRVGRVGRFDIAARLHRKDEMEAADERAWSSAIVARVRNAGARYKQLAMALTTAIVPPSILGE